MWGYGRLLVCVAALGIAACGNSAQVQPNRQVTSEAALLKILGLLDGGDGKLQNQAAKYNERFVLGVAQTLSWTDEPTKVPTPGSGTDTFSIGLAAKFLDQDAIDRLHSSFPDGSGPNGTTAAAHTTPLDPGLYLLAWMTMDGNIPIEDRLRHYQFAVCFRQDADPANDYVPPSQVINDFFKGMDRSYELLWNPSSALSLISRDFRNGIFRSISSAARAIVCENALVFVIPKGELPDLAFLPPFRVSAFCHTGQFGQDGQWDGSVRPHQNDEPAHVSTYRQIMSVPSVEIEAKFITVEQGFSEEVGIDLDLTLDTEPTAATQPIQSKHERTIVLSTGDVGGRLDEQAEALVALLDAPPRQVRIEPRLVEVTRKDLDELGIGIFPSLPGDFDFLLQDPDSFQVPTPVTRVDPIPPIAASGVIPDLQLGGTLLNFSEVQLLLRQMEDSGTSDIVQAPKLLALDGQEAFIEVSNSTIPVTQLEARHQNAVNEHDPSVSDVEAGPHVQLRVRVLPDGENVRITILVDSFGSMVPRPGSLRIGNQSLNTMLPAIQEANVETQVVVEDGDTILLGGLKQRADTDFQRGVPILSNIPAFGFFFQRRIRTDENRELLIMLTPRIVRLDY